MVTIQIVDNIANVQETIATACVKANRNSDDVTLVAVSKQKPVDAILAAMQAGLTHFGENRVGEFTEKIPLVNNQVSRKPTWHMIGHIQSRKAKDVVPLIDYVHSIDRLKIARKLSDLAQATNKTISALVEVNASGEAAKYGFEVSGWQDNEAVKDAFWQDMRAIMELPNLEIRGLMTMAPFYDNMEDTRPIFADVAALRACLQGELDISLPDLSMGMTNDYAVAIEEGATIVRVGRAIFGNR